VYIHFCYQLFNYYLASVVCLPAGVALLYGNNYIQLFIPRHRAKKNTEVNVAIRVFANLSDFG